MKRPARRCVRLVAGALMIPPLLWGAILLLLPMGWARTAVIKAVGAATNQDVRVGSVRLKPLGGVEVLGLELAARQNPADPWLKVEGLSIDVSARDLAFGRVEPTEIRAWGVTGRVRRDAEGRLEFADLFAPAPDDKDASGSASSSDENGREVRLILERGAVTLIDEASDARMEFTDIEARATADRRTVALTQLTAGLNGGTFEAAARLDRDDEATLEAQIRAENVALGVGMAPLMYVIPLLAPDSSASGAHARGTLSLGADLKARGASGDAIARTLHGRGQVTLDGLNLDDSRILDELGTHLPIPTGGKVGSLRGHFNIADRRVGTSDTVLKVAEVPVNLAGWSDFDGNLDYLVKCEKLDKVVSKLTTKLSDEAKELLADLPVDDLKNLTDVRVAGTIDHPTVRPADGGLLSRKNGGTEKDPARKASDRAKLKEAGRRLFDRVMR